MMIRPYRGSDIPQIIALWNEQMPLDPITEKAFVKNILLDLNFDPENFLVACLGDEILGFVYTVVRRIPVDTGGSMDADRGWICAIALREGNPAIGRPLLQQAETRINRDHPRRIFACSYTPNYFYQGINSQYANYLQLFQESGYTECERSVSMSLELDSYRTPDGIEALRQKLEQEGIRFQDLTAEHIPSWLTFQKPSWTHRFRRLLLETGQFGNITVAVKDGEVIGCNIFGDPYSDEGRFGPFGVRADFQSRGIGKVLLDDCMRKMKARGIPVAWMQWATAAEYVVDLYRKFGFRIMNTYITFTKQETEDPSNG